MKKWILRTFFRDVYDRNFDAELLEENLKVSYWLMKSENPDVADFARFMLNSATCEPRVFQFRLGEFIREHRK